jgi:hypothetical protein
MFLAATLIATPTPATPLVTFYDDQTSFLAAVASPTVLDFEGIAPDKFSVDFGTSYQTGAVTFTSGFNDHIVVVGKSSPTLGEPFDSALLIPNVDPGSMLATFQTGSNVTAVGGFFLNLFGNTQELATVTLTGANGVLDSETLRLGIATSGKPKTFLGYIVAGDTIKSLSVNISTDTPAFDDFTYGRAVPEPTSVAQILMGAAVLFVRLWRRRWGTADYAMQATDELRKAKSGCGIAEIQGLGKRCCIGQT